MSTMTECSVCVSDFTITKRKEITCSSCKYSCCLECVKTYLLGTSDDPHCMNCRRGWDRDFQYEILGKSFVNTTLHKHRKDMFLEREKAQIPATQPHVDYKYKEREILNEISEIKTEMALICQKLAYKQRVLQHHRTGGHEITQEKRSTTTTIKCPGDGCRGYIIGKVCKMCNVEICRECISIVNNGENNEHVCDEDTKKTAQLILKDTKPCPGCGERISKVSGCDQMWCTQCNVAFSWRTGKQVHGTIHNPHYYEYMRNEGDRHVAVRNPNDLHCGGIINIPTLRRNKFKSGNCNTYDIVMKIHRSVVHVQHSIINPLRRKLQENNEIKLRSLRCKYMMNEIDVDNWKKRIGMIENEREREQASLHIYETFVTVLTEQFNTYITSGYDELTGETTFNRHYPNFIQNVKGIASYVETQLIRISKNYNMSVYKIIFTDNNCYVHTVKTKY